MAADDESVVREFYAPVQVNCTQAASGAWVLWLDEVGQTYLTEHLDKATAWHKARKHIEGQ